MIIFSKNNKAATRRRKSRIITSLIKNFLTIAFKLINKKKISQQQQKNEVEENFNLFELETHLNLK